MLNPCKKHFIFIIFRDQTLNFTYVLCGIGLGVAFLLVGILLLRKLNLNYEDIYEEKKKSVRSRAFELNFIFRFDLEWSQSFSPYF